MVLSSLGPIYLQFYLYLPLYFPLKFLLSIKQKWKFSRIRILTSKIEFQLLLSRKIEPKEYVFVPENQITRIIFHINKHGATIELSPPSSFIVSPYTVNYPKSLFQYNIVRNISHYFKKPEIFFEILVFRKAELTVQQGVILATLEPNQGGLPKFV